MTTAIFLTLLASVAGMILACANSLAHDLFAHGLHGSRKRNKEPVAGRIEMGTAQGAAVAVGLLAITARRPRPALEPPGAGDALLLRRGVGLAPALVYSMFWRRYTRTGLLCTLIGGTAAVLVLITGTNLVSGSPGVGLPRTRLQLVPVHHDGPRLHPGRLPGGLAGHDDAPGARPAEERSQYEAVEPWILAGAPPAAARR